MNVKLPLYPLALEPLLVEAMLESLMKKEDLLLANLAAFMSHSSLSVTGEKLDHLIMLHLIAR
jgi:hypothetical protein